MYGTRRKFLVWIEGAGHNWSAYAVKICWTGAHFSWRQIDEHRGRCKQFRLATRAWTIRTVVLAKEGGSIRDERALKDRELISTRSSLGYSLMRYKTVSQC